jgi:hypothetical protein
MLRVVDKALELSKHCRVRDGRWGQAQEKAESKGFYLLPEEEAHAKLHGHGDVADKGRARFEPASADLGD